MLKQVADVTGIYRQAVKKNKAVCAAWRVRDTEIVSDISDI